MRGLATGRWRLTAAVAALLMAAAFVSAALARSRPRPGPRAVAAGRALHALGSARHRGAEIVFGLPVPLPAGTVITEGGPSRPGTGGRLGGPQASPARVIARLQRRAWLFYEDLAPFQQYAHPGRIALVDAVTGRVSLSPVIQWPPVVDGRLPAFLASQITYDSGADRVFYRPYTVTPTPDFTGAIATRAARAAADPGSIDPAEGPLVARLIAADHACAVRFTDTVRGGYYAFAHITQSRAALDYRFTQLDQMGARMPSLLYTPRSRLSPTRFVARQIARHGCRDVLLYLAGAGYGNGPAVNIGMGVGRRDVVHQDVTASELRALIAGHRGVHFELVVDAAHSGAFHALARRLSNLLLVVTAAAPHGGAFTYLPQVRVGGRLEPNRTNPLRLLQLTDRLVYGIDRVTYNPLEVAQMQALRQAGRLPSALAYLVARAFSRGGAVDFVGQSGAGAAPDVQVQGFSAGAPSPPAPAPPGGGSTPPPAAAPVLGGVASAPLAYDAGAFPVPVAPTLTATSPDGAGLTAATVSISTGFAAGQDALSFTPQHGITGAYDAATGVLALTGPATAADYQAALRSVTYDDADGATPALGPRTISFRVQDGTAPSGLSNAVARTVQVNPNPPPVAAADTVTTDKHTPVTIDVLANDSDPNGLPLHVDPASIVTTATKGTVTINPDNTITYNPNGQFDSLQQGQTATDTFTYAASNGFHDSAPATVTVTVTGVNTPPVLANLGSPLSYQVQSAAVPVSPALTISDEDDGTMSSATVSITGGLNPAADQLSFTNQNGITGSYDSATGVLTLTGSATLADYQAALRSVAFSTSDGSASPAPRTVTFTVTDSTATASAPAGRQIDVSAVPQAPVANPDSYGAAGNTPLAVGTAVSGPAVTLANGSVLNNDSDPNAGGTLSVTGNTQPANGTVAVNRDGTFTYTPNAGFTGTDTFTYTVTDSASGKTATGDVSIAVGPVVWYVDDSRAGAGNGTADAPFNTLAAANGAAGSNSIVFLYQGSAPYTGGAMMQPGEQLLGQPHGLVVGGNLIVPAGGTAPTITNAGGDGIDLAEGADVEGVAVSGTSGNGIAAANVNGATVGQTTPVSVSSAGADGLHVTGGSGALNLSGLSISGAAGHSVAISGRSGGTVTIGGSVKDSGTGISLTSNTGATIDLAGTLTLSTGAAPAFTATGGGTVDAAGSASTIATTAGTAVDVANTTIGTAGLRFQSVAADGAPEGIDLSNTGSTGPFTVTGTGSAGSGGTLNNATATDAADAHLGAATFEHTGPVSLSDMTITSPAGDGVGALEVPSLTLHNNTISGAGDDGVLATLGTGTGDTTGGTFDIAGNTITGAADTAVSYVSQSGGMLTGFITANTIGNAGNAATSGAVADGIDLWSTGSGGTITASITNNSITGIAQGFGINAKAQDQPGAAQPPTLNLTVTGNTIDDSATTTQDGMTFASGNALPDVVCLDVSGNTSMSGGTAAGNLNYDADGMSAYQMGDTSVFEIVGGPSEAQSGANPNNILEDPNVESYLAGQNTLTGPGGAAYAAQEGAAGFTGAGACPTPPAPLAAHVARLARVAGPVITAATAPVRRAPLDRRRPRLRLRRRRG